MKRKKQLQDFLMYSKTCNIKPTTNKQLHQTMRSIQFWYRNYAQYNKLNAKSTTKRKIINLQCSCSPNCIIRKFIWVVEQFSTYGVCHRQLIPLLRASFRKGLGQQLPLILHTEITFLSIRKL
jgi:hypothetical protein